MSHTVRAYGKPAKTPSDLVAHIQRRGLAVTDVAACEAALSFVGYYRLLIYMRPLQLLPSKAFKGGTSFDDVLALYNFDRELRLLCLDAVEKVEVALRAAIINTLAVAHGPHFHCESVHYQDYEAFSGFLRIAADAKYLAIHHYKQRYNSPPIAPIWAISEAITYGVLSRLYSGLHLDNRKLVAKQFGYDEAILVSWFRSLNVLRNMCAHHNRLWNATIEVDKPRIAKALKTEFTNTNTFHARAIVLVALLAVIDPTSDWKHRLKALTARYPVVSSSAMGFPSGWQGRAFWS
ncbi:Abi family protein [Gemmatimonas sp. UBA7669]|uniref:Abi family protein n=1 Tax=Gemmatimonas sp. UBA7669 TaxID=1946568 RepID=UPI0025BE8101|nr:Abi family protein [Gemmatimonas sp. UBA7669]